jgi:hypothetical protein
MANILFFAPFADIWVHSQPELAVALECAHDGHQVTLLRCRGLLKESCAAIESAGVTRDTSEKRKEQICHSCRETVKLMNRFSTIRQYWIEDFYTGSDESWVDEKLSGLDLEGWKDFQIDNINVGRLATYESILRHKLTTSDEITSVWSEYRATVRNCLVVQRTLSNYFANQTVDRVVVYNHLYSVNRIAVQVAEARGIAWRSIHAGKNVRDRLQTISVIRTDHQDALSARSDSWRHWHNVPLLSDEVDSVKQYLEFLFTGFSAFVYSHSKSRKGSRFVRNFLGIEPKKRVLLATMASADERVAANSVGAIPKFSIDVSGELFTSTVEWIDFLVDFVEHQSDIHLVLRPHPREFVNKREHLSSRRLPELLRALSLDHDRVSVSLPEHPFGLYDLASITDVVLNTTSNAGLELMALGLPVASYSYSQLLSYPPEFNYVGQSEMGYRNAIQSALQESWSLQHSVNAFRFRAFQFKSLSISLHDRITDRNTLSLHRVLYGLRGQFGWRIPKPLLTGARLHEVRQQESRLLHGPRLVDAIIEERDSDARDYEVYPRNTEDETEFVRRALTQLCIRFLDNEPGSLGWKIRQNLR